MGEERCGGTEEHQMVGRGQLRGLRVYIYIQFGLGTILDAPYRCGVTRHVYILHAYAVTN